MSDRRSSADLGASAEAALSGFPCPERDWESDARNIEARIVESARGSTDALLLAAPLPAEPGEPAAQSATTTPLASSGVRTQSLAEMARRSVEQKQSAEREMARASLALAAQQRPSGEGTAVKREAVSAVHALAAPPPPPSTARVANAPKGAAQPIASAPRAESPWPKLGLAAGGLALAAAALLWLRHPAPEPLVSGVVAKATAAQVGADDSAPVAVAAAPNQVATVAAPGAPVAVDPSTLTEEGASKTADAKHTKALATGAAAAAMPSASAVGPSPEKIVLEDDQTAAPAAPADKPVEKALPPDPALRPADSTGGAIPVKPSTGAVQAALGAVMSGARHCVAGDEEASSAVVVFASDGHVQSVTVHGPAAGKPSGTCIEGQLSHARVQPFAASSFSINATVRPD